MEIHICEVCGNEHDGSYGSGRFCSEHCKQEFVGLNCNHICKCKFCGREFKNGRSLGGHTITCKMNPSRKKTIENSVRKEKENRDKKDPKSIYKLTCSCCGNDYELELRKSKFESGHYRHTCSDKCAHTRKFSDELKSTISNKIKAFIKNNKSSGCFHLSSEPKIMKYVCEECNNEFEMWDKRQGNGKTIQVDFFSHRFCSEECRQIHMKKVLSEKTKKRCVLGEFGGKNNETYKKHKHGWYRGLYCGSSWELAFVLWMTHQGFEVKRSELKLQYDYNGKKYNYYPDYEVNGKTYEVKGFEDYKAQAKHEAFPWIEYYNRDKMKRIIKEVKKLYGKDFVDLLEEHK